MTRSRHPSLRSRSNILLTKILRSLRWEGRNSQFSKVFRCQVRTIFKTTEKLNFLSAHIVHVYAYNYMKCSKVIQRATRIPQSSGTTSYIPISSAFITTMAAGVSVCVYMFVCVSVGMIVEYKMHSRINTEFYHAYLSRHLQAAPVTLPSLF